MCTLRVSPSRWQCSHQYFLCYVSTAFLDAIGSGPFFHICVQFSLWALLSLLLSRWSRKSYTASKVDMAEAANQKGSILYKEGEFAKWVIPLRSFSLFSMPLQSTKMLPTGIGLSCISPWFIVYYSLFFQAVKLDPKEPKYASNLSAVLYELGRYDACIVAIHLSWNPLRLQSGKPLTPPESDPLALKLATRFAKAKLNGIKNNTISLHGEAPTQPNSIKNDQVAKDLEADIEKFAMLERDGNVDAKVKEMRAIWEAWRSVREKCSSHSLKECQATLSVAQTRFNAMPIFKGAAWVAWFSQLDFNLNIPQWPNHGILPRNYYPHIDFSFLIFPR